MTYLHAFISAETEEQAHTILDALLEKKLITGGPILQGPAKFWWKGEVVEMNYTYILTYTTEKHKEAVIEAVKEVSEEEVPMISFMSFEGNKELESYIDSVVG